MTFVWLEHSVQDSPLVQEIGETSHVYRVEQVDLHKGLVSNTIAKKWHALYEGDVTNIDGLSIVGVAAIGCGESMVNRGSEGENV